MEKYYLYEHRTLDDQVFYIGKGTFDKRHSCGGFQRAYSRSNRTKKWKEIASKGYNINIIFKSDNLENILNKENSLWENCSLCVNVQKNTKFYNYKIYRISENICTLHIFNKIYLIYDSGKIFNSFGKELKPSDNSNGYKLLTFSNGESIRKNLYVHRIVAEGFLSNPLHLSNINHKDLNRSNNSSDNLEWVTQQENITYSVNLSSYIFKERIKPILQFKKTGEFVKEWDRASSISKVFSCTQEAIQQSCQQKNLKCITSKNYIWIYKEDYENNNTFKFNKTLEFFKEKEKIKGLTMVKFSSIVLYNT